jgi:DNA-binding IclR family transcriptional regulator
MVALPARRPAVCAPAAASALGLSDDAALRVLTRLERCGLVREITGQGRLRVWAARL